VGVRGSAASGAANGAAAALEDAAKLPVSRESRGKRASLRVRMCRAAEEARGTSGTRARNSLLAARGACRP